MHVLDANEIFGMTFYTANRILEDGWRNWPDALALYIKLLAQTRMQETNQTLSKNEFLQKAMWWWRERLQAAKKVLNELGLIDYLQIRDDQGKMKAMYVRVNYLIDEESIRANNITYNLQVDHLTGCGDNRLTVSSSDGETTTNALSNKIENAWRRKKENTGEKIPTVVQLLEAYKQDERLIKQLPEEHVKRWATYKQSKKSTAYKSLGGFIQQLHVYVNMVSNWSLQLDTWLRFGFALNQAIDNGRKWMVRDDKIESQYRWWKKIYLLEKQNE